MEGPPSIVASSFSSTSDVPVWAYPTQAKEHIPRPDGQGTIPAYIIHVDPNNPDHREFEIVKCPRLEHEGWSRGGFYCRTDTGIEDAENWEVTMYHQPPFDKCSRAVLVKGIKKSAYKIVDQLCKKDKCKGYLEILTDYMARLESDPNKVISHWLLIFPAEIELDNVIFSGDPIHVNIDLAGVKQDHDGLPENTMFIKWKIAVRDGGHRIAQKTKKMAKSAFD